MRRFRAEKNNRIITKGSLICAISIIMLIFPQAALAASMPAEVAALPEPQIMSVEKAKNGIVRVNAGVETDNGGFDVESTSSGFIVGNDGNNVYVVTAFHAVDYGQNGRIQIIVKNDSAVDASIELSNRQKDYCILAAENKFNDRDIVPLRVPSYDAEGETLSDGDDVTALGFPLSMGSSSDFSASDVPAKKGEIISTADENGGILLHDSKVLSGFEGGPVVDKDGYAVGLILDSDKKGSAAALDITEVDISLYQDGIAYRSKDKDLMYEELYDLCVGAEELYSKAEGDSKTEISRAYNNAISTMNNGPYDRDALSSSLSDFRTVIGDADYKTPKALVLVIVLAAVIAFLAIRLVMLISWNKRYSYVMEPEKIVPMEPQMPSGSQLRQESYSQSAAYMRTDALKKPTLTVLRTGMTITLNDRVTTLGKSNESSISIPDNKKVSRHHAMIEERGGSYFLNDQGSTNGTFLNNMPVNSAGMRLRSGDIIRLADEAIQFRQD